MTGAVVRSTARLSAIAPQFLVDDLDAAIAYYRDKLGFEVDFTYESFYASVSRDGLPIHLKHAPKTVSDRAHRKQHEHLDAYVAITGVETFYQELKSRGARITKPLEERPWGHQDFYVEDIDEYILCFSEQKA
jgi:catechol 2,3-dioxygenase-like lactoylglutathione lyase family enzyme